MPHDPKKTDHPASKAWFWIDAYYAKRQKYFEDSGYKKRLPDSHRDLKLYLKTMGKFIDEYEQRGKEQGLDYIACLDDLKKTLQKNEDSFHRGTFTHYGFEDMKTLWHITCRFSGLMDEKLQFGGVP